MQRAIEPPSGSVDESADLPALAILRDRLDDGYRYLLDHRTSKREFESGVRRYQGLATRYVVGLSKWADDVGHEELDELRRDYSKRLNKGWAMAESDAVAEQFHKVMREYEVICDGLYGAERISSELAAKVKFVEATRRPAVRRLMGKE